MKKLIIVLMVVAMASFLFVGCLPGGVTPEPEPPAPTPIPTVKTDTPFITEIGTDATNAFDLSSADTQYLNSIDVGGVGAPGSIIKMYVNDVWVGTGSAGANGIIVAIPVVLADLADGVKTVYITATQSGFAVSEKSTIYTLTLDTVKPKIVSAVADSTDQTVTVTFSEAVLMNTPTSGSAPTKSALIVANWNVQGSALTYLVDTVTKVSSKVVKINVLTAGAPVVPTAGEVFNVTLLADSVVQDLAGNVKAITADQIIFGTVQD